MATPSVFMPGRDAVSGATISGMPVSTIVGRQVVTPGIDRLLTVDRRLIAGRRVGLVCNPASVDGRLAHTADRLHDDPDVTLAALFGPQHGFRSDLQDNMIETPHGEDRRRRVPVFSLYSDTREPTADMLAGLDVLVIDLQDVGTRVYTYIYTMANCMRAAARRGLPVVVCDRPNPIGGDEVEGACLQTAWSSFVGQFPIPMRHGMTIGELARLFNDAFGIGARLDVVSLDGWRRSMYFDETGAAVGHPVAESPHARQRHRLPRCRPHRRDEAVRGPWHDAAVRAHRGAVDRRRAAGRGDERERPARRAISGRCSSSRRSRNTPARPAAAARSTCIDRRAFQPLRAAVELIDEFRREDPARFAWREPPYEYEHDKEPIDILYGSDRLRRTLDERRQRDRARRVRGARMKSSSGACASSLREPF